MLIIVIILYYYESIICKENHKQELSAFQCQLQQYIFK